MGQAGRSQEGRYRQGTRLRHHPALLRLQLDGTRRPRPSCSQETDRRLPQSRSGQPGAQGNHGVAACLEVHSDQEGELRRHRKGCPFGWPAEVSFRLDGVGLPHANGFTELADINLQAAQGERIALIGPSGAGKTSLLSVLGTALAPSTGRAAVLGTPLQAEPSKTLRARIGTVHQAPPVPGREGVGTAVVGGELGAWPAWKSLASLLYPLDLPGAQAALGRVDLADKLFVRSDQLSGGQLQRVGIARVLYQQPELILADEPVSALDPALALATVRCLIADADARGATLVASLHAVDLDLGNFTRIVGVKAGRIAFDLPVAEVGSALLHDLYASEGEELPVQAHEPAFLLQKAAANDAATRSAC